MVVMKKILVTGSLGQIGSDLVLKLAKVYGKNNIIASDVLYKDNNLICSNFKFEIIDVLDIKKIGEIVDKYQINYVIHLASLLSATGEKYPQKLWELNMGGLYNVLEIGREKKCGVFTPSSIAAFGMNTPQENTPQDTIQRPETIYGISKVAGELLCDYYFQKFGVDTRSVRLPGLVSYTAPAGGGTTDYAVDIFYKAVAGEKFVCPLSENTYLDMMYMDDALDAIIKLMEADGSRLIHRNAFNISGMSISPKEIYLEIKKHKPDFVMDYSVNVALQKIADSWPNSMDISCAKTEWDFETKVDLAKMTKIMLNNVKVIKKQY